MSEQVREMFSSIAPRYDVTNEVLSFGVHRLWRRATVKASGATPGQKVIDCACGTGDLSLAFARAVGPSGEVVGTDFCEPMIVHARQKAARAGMKIDFAPADALHLPYPDGRFDIASIAFGIRNVDDPLACLRELSRVVRSGGRVVVLEFGQPSGLYGALYRTYSRILMPWIGGVLTGNRSAYEYLPSTAAAFPAGKRFIGLMEQAETFKARRARSLWFGTAWVYVGEVA